MTDIANVMASLEAMQNERLISLHFPHSDGPDSTLLVNHINVHEYLSRDFEIQASLLCVNPRLAQKDLMGRMVTFELECADASVRYFNGYVFEFQLSNVDGGYSFYNMVVRPWTRFLDLRKNNRLFQEKSLPDALKVILADYGTLPDIYFKLQGTPQAETFRAQWDETDYNYLHRRLEDKGWYYYFEHTANSHKLVICDDSTLADPIDGKPQVKFHSDISAAEEDVISEWSPSREVTSGRFRLTSWDFKNPRPLQVEIDTVNRQGDVRPFDVYEYTGAYGYANQEAGDRLAKLRMEEIECRAKTFFGSGNCRLLQPGRTFELIHHFDHDKDDSDDRQFLILEAHHTANNNYLQTGSEAVYFNEIYAIRKKIPFRPGRRFHSEQPNIYGIQTAVVVGPAGEVIHCDEYSRIKIQFHWDLHGQYNEKSSCWVRVASTWAGDNFGAIAIPRIGQEVIVQFLSGNPDLPVVTGSVYNANNMPPWNLPDNRTQSGILTRTPHGTPANANALRFEDKKGQEEIWLHAEKDQRIEVENDESHTVGHDRTKTIGNDETVHVKHDRTETVDNNETITVHNNRQERVDHNETISIGLNRAEDVGVNETIKIGGHRTVTIGGNKAETIALAKEETIGLVKLLTTGGLYQISVGGAMNTTVALMQADEVGLSKLIKVMQDFSTSVGKTFSVVAGGEGGSTLTMDADSITLQIGKATISMKKSGEIEISGTKVTLAGTDSVNFVSPNINNN